MSVAMARTEARKSFDTPTRLSLLESDVDELEASLAKIGERLGKIMATCLAILTSLVVASIMLAVNLATGA